MERLIGIVGLVVLLGLAYACSSHRRSVPWRLVAIGLGLQLALGLLLLKAPYTAAAFEALTYRVKDFLALSQVGGRFVFGSLVDVESFGFIIAVQILPTIIFFSSVIAILYYLGLAQRIIVFVSRIIHRLLGTSGAETLSVTGNIFVGMSEAPLMIRPYLARLTNSELHAVMVGGFATIAGGVFAAYVGFGISATHLIVASVMSAPAALVVAKIMVPETERPDTLGHVRLPKVDVGSSLVDAAARGATDGMKLGFNVLVMLIAFLSLIACVDWLLLGLDTLIDGWLLGGAAYWANETVQGHAGIVPANLRTIFGTLLAPLAFVMGVPWSEATQVGHLLGLKIATNEFVAYAELRGMMQGQELSERSTIIATYALCGFANFGSVGIQIGGIGALAPERRSDLARLGIKAMFGGALASWMTATIAGMLL